MSAFQKLVEHSNKVFNFGHLASIVGWDQAAVMPAGGAEARSNAVAELEVHIHSLMTQPHLGDLFAQAEEESLSAKEQAVLREMKRDWQQANLLPESLVQAQSLAGSKCE
ncbi:carboxypeptidase M32, partial [Vibrio rotiferianus]